PSVVFGGPRPLGARHDPRMVAPLLARAAPAGGPLALRVGLRILCWYELHLLEGRGPHLARPAPAATLTPVLVLLAATATGVSSYRLASFFSKKFVALGITGVDIHKLDRP